MKKITVLVTALLFAFAGFAQLEKVNWLTTAEFEAAVKEGKKNCFIFIEDKNKSIQVNDTIKLHNLTRHINKNFICYKFDSSLKNITFQGKKYKKTQDKRGHSSHEFTAFLTGTSKSAAHTIVLRDQKFNLLEINNKEFLKPLGDLRLPLESVFHPEVLSVGLLNAYCSGVPQRKFKSEK